MNHGTIGECERTTTVTRLEGFKKSLQKVSFPLRQDQIAAREHKCFDNLKLILDDFFVGDVNDDRDAIERKIQRRTGKVLALETLREIPYPKFLLAQVERSLELCLSELTANDLFRRAQQIVRDPLEATTFDRGFRIIDDNRIDRYAGDADAGRTYGEYEYAKAIVQALQRRVPNLISNPPKPSEAFPSKITQAECEANEELFYEAFQLLDKTANAGYITGQRMLGIVTAQTPDAYRFSARAIPVLQDASAHGDAPAMYALSRLHAHNGNKAEAANFLEQAVASNYPPAKYARALELLRDGNALDSLHEACALIAAAADDELPEAQIVMLGNEARHNEPYAMLRRLADRGIAEAHLRLGRMYESGTLVHPDLQKAYLEYKYAAAQGLSEAQLRLGLFLEEGTGVRSNAVAAAQQYRLASLQGESEATYRLGRCHEYGAGLDVEIHKALECYRQAAEGGSASALYRLGMMHFYGEHLAQSDEEAARLFRRAADAGHGEAYYRLGSMHADGVGVEKSDEAAFACFEEASVLGSIDGQREFAQILERSGDPGNMKIAALIYRRAAAKGDLTSQLRFAKMLLQGEGVDRDPQKAIEFFGMAIAQGSSQARYDLARVYLDSPYVERSYQKAAELLQAAVADGLARAEYALGTLLEHGHGVDRNLQSAIRLYKSAANKENLEAIKKIAICYEEGLGLDQDHAAAFAAYTTAANLGDLDSQFKVGEMYRIGSGTAKDETAAFEAFRAAAQGGHAAAQRNAAYFLEHGIGTAQNTHAARELYESSARQGNAAAQFALGNMHYLGKFIAKNDAIAFRYYEQAAQANHIAAQYNLGFMHETGRIANGTLAQAIEWYRRAADGGHAMARTRLRKLQVQAA